MKLLKRFVVICCTAAMITGLLPVNISYADSELDYIKGRPLTEQEIEEQKAMEPELEQLPRFDKEIVTISSEASELNKNRGAYTEAVYDLREQSYYGAINVKDQQETGMCWAFGTTTAAEISRAKQLAASGESVTNIEFSPLHLAYFLYHRQNDPLGKTKLDKNLTVYDYKDIGGNSYLTFQLLANWTGLTLESKMPFKSRKNSSFDRDLAYDNDYVIESAEFITDSISVASADSVKKAIVEYGSVVADMYYSNKYWNANTSAYKTNMSASYGNHIITIVGWDDTYSKENFRSIPENDGAWIVQNSYGSEWGDDGYMYISYEDKSLACPMALKVVPADEYDYNYQYDGNVSPAACDLSAGNKIANIFSVPSNSEIQYLKAVGFTTLNAKKTNYVIDIYTDITNSSKPTSGTKACSFNVSTDNEGYFTFETPSQIKLTPGKKYSIVITLKNNTSFGVENEEDYDWIEFVAGHIAKSSFVYDGSWHDLYNSDICARIKGLTVENKPISISKVAVDMEYSNYSYTGVQRKPDVILKYNGRTLEEGIDYTVSYGENLYPGKGQVYISGIGDFGGNITESFEIAKVSGLKVASYGTKSLKLKWNSAKNVDGYKIYMYKDNSYKCVKTVQGFETTSTTISGLTPGKGYTFKICSYVGTHNGSISDKMRAPVKPSKGSLKKLKTGSSHYVTAYWYKRTGTGYQIKRATNSKFTSNVKTYKVTSSNTLSKKMTGLTKGKTYYVKVRAYKTYGGKTVYGPWSGYKKIKCK